MLRGGRVRKNKHEVKLNSFEVGDDLIVVLTGGDKAHAGAVAVALPYKKTACSSVISLPEHKDSDLAKPLAERIAKKTKKRVIMIAGLHIDNATEDDIYQLVKNSEKVVDEFIGA